MPSPTRDPRRRPSVDSIGSTRRESNARRSPSPVPGPSSRPERRTRDNRVTDNSSWAKPAPPSATSSSFPPPISATSTSFMSPPPPPPPSTNVVQPPPPPPPGPTVLDLIPPPPDHPTLGLKQPKYELSTEEKRKIWEQRLSLWVSWNKMRASIIVLEDRIKVTQSIIGSLPPSNSVASRSKELERLKQELSDQHARFKQHFNKIVETDSWPMAPRPEQGVIENKYADMVKLVDTVTKNISELNISINKMREEQFGPEETTTLSSRKQRRLSDGGLDDSSFNAAELREGIDAVESQLLDLQNLLLNHDNDIQAEVIALMENRYEELEAARNAGTDPEAQFRQISSIRLHTVEQQLGEVAVEMADVMTKADERDADQDEVKRENAALQDDIYKLRARVQTWETREKESIRQMDAVKAALDDYKSNPALPPVPISPEHLRPHIESVVLPVIRENVQSMIDQLRENIQQSIVQREMEIYGAVWDKLKLAGSISETVVARMEAPPSASTVPAPK